MLSSIRKTASHSRAYDTPVKHVQEGLALTPSEMLTMSQSGVPISSQMLSADAFNPGHEGSEPSVPYELRRGVDISDVAYYQQQTRAKVKSVSQS